MNITSPRFFFLLILLASFCFSSSPFGVTEQLPEDEVQALKGIAKTLGKEWDSSIDNPCGGQENFSSCIEVRNETVSVICNCSYADGTVCHITHLCLKLENLSGTLPQELVKLRYHQDIDLYFNYLNGTIPKEWGSMNLVNISLGGNRLTGSIPPEIGNISTLRDFVVEFNQLSGNLPPELGKLTQLQRLTGAASSVVLTSAASVSAAVISQCRDSPIVDTGAASSTHPWIELGNLILVNKAVVFEAQDQLSNCGAAANIKRLGSFNSRSPATQAPTEPLTSNVLPSQSQHTAPISSPSPHVQPTSSPSLNVHHTSSPLSPPLESPLPSPIAPQPSSAPPTSEETLPHAQSSAVNSQEDETVIQEGILEIKPYGDEFNPSNAIRLLTAAIKSKFDWFCPTWGHATKEMRDLWFKEFQKHCKWEPKYNARIRQIFDIKGDARFRGMMCQERKNYAKNSDYRPKYIPPPIWDQLIHYWASDRTFKKYSAANIVNRASNVGSSMHTGGSISMGEHARRMEKATGVTPTIEEVFAKCHLKKDKRWVDDRSEQAIGEFKKRKAELSQGPLFPNEEDIEGSFCENHNMPNDLTIWNKVVPKGKKGIAYGLGSMGSHLASKFGTGACSFTSKDANIEQELTMWQEKAKEQELINKEQKAKLDVAERKLEDQGKRMQIQQKRIESTENTIITLFRNLNMPLPPNFSNTSMQDELGESANDNEDDNIGDD